MYKVVIQKRADWPHEEFMKHWRTEHVPKASEMPHVRKYTTVVILDEDAAFDGIAELYFDEGNDVQGDEDYFVSFAKFDGDLISYDNAGLLKSYSPS